MTDDEFRLTPVDVRNQEFRFALRGYDPAAVEDFRSRVAEELERLLRERVTLDERIHNFREQLKAFREREKAMNDALISAHKLRDEAQAAAQREVDSILREARFEGERILTESRDMEKSVRRDAKAARRQFTGYLAGFRQLLERNLSEVEALEAHERDMETSRDGHER